MQILFLHEIRFQSIDLIPNFIIFKLRPTGQGHGPALVLYDRIRKIRPESQSKT